MTKDPGTPKAATFPKRKARVNSKPAPALPPATTRSGPLATLLAQR